MSKTVLVTGGSGEIGSAICRLFAANGYDVIITYNSNSDRAKKLLDSLPKGKHMVFQAPTTNPDKIKELKLAFENNYKSLDVLVNNAGITTPVAHDDLDGLTDEWIDKIMQTNFRGSFAMVRAFKDSLTKTNEPSAVVVNISSIASIFGIGSNVAYCASKAALDSMTRSLARVLAPGIRVVSVSPGFVEGEYTANMEPAFISMQKNNTPLGRFALGEDVAQAVYAVATQLTFSTGNIITVDGGRLL